MSDIGDGLAVKNWGEEMLIPRDVTGEAAFIFLVIFVGCEDISQAFKTLESMLWFVFESLEYFHQQHI